MESLEVDLIISEAAARLGVGVHSLRYYERAKLLTVPRGPRGFRRYGLRELAALTFIKRLRDTGMPVARIREYVDIVRTDPATHEQLMEILLEHRFVVQAALAEQKRHLDAIDAKIAFYQGHAPARPPGANTP